MSGYLMIRTLPQPKHSYQLQSGVIKMKFIRTKPQSKLSYQVKSVVIKMTGGSTLVEVLWCVDHYDIFISPQNVYNILPSKINLNNINHRHN